MKIKLLGEGLALRRSGISRPRILTLLGELPILPMGHRSTLFADYFLELAAGQRVRSLLKIPTILPDWSASAQPPRNLLCLLRPVN